MLPPGSGRGFLTPCILPCVCWFLQQRQASESAAGGAPPGDGNTESEEVEEDGAANAGIEEGVDDDAGAGTRAEGPDGSEDEAGVPQPVNVGAWCLWVVAACGRAPLPLFCIPVCGMASSCSRLPFCPPISTWRCLALSHLRVKTEPAHPCVSR